MNERTITTNKIKREENIRISYEYDIDNGSIKVVDETNRVLLHYVQGKSSMTAKAIQEILNMFK